MSYKCSNKKGVLGQEQGLSLIELMVALLISTVLLGGAFKVLISSKESGAANEELARIQENLRIASEIISSDLRLAGYFGCARLPESVFSQLKPGVPGNFHDIGPVSSRRLIEGVNDVVPASSKWEPSKGDQSIADIVAGTDAITMRAAGGVITLAGEISTPLSVDMQSESDNITVEDKDALITVGNIVVIHDCSDADIFQVTGFDNNGVIQHAQGGRPPGNVAGTLSKPYDTKARVSALNFARYFIKEVDNNPVLHRQVFLTSPLNSRVVSQPIVDGIENMQILYGVDTDGDARGLPDEYVVADVVADWKDVKSVRIALLARSVDESNMPPDTNTYNLNGVTFDPPDDRRLRKVLTTTVSFRNFGEVKGQ